MLSGLSSGPILGPQGGTSLTSTCETSTPVNSKGPMSSKILGYSPCMLTSRISIRSMELTASECSLILTLPKDLRGEIIVSSSSSRLRSVAVIGDSVWVCACSEVLRPLMKSCSEGKGSRSLSVIRTLNRMPVKCSPPRHTRPVSNAFDDETLKASCADRSFNAND